MDSGPGDDSTERIGEEAHLGCAEDPGKDGLEPGLGSAMIARSGTQSSICRATCLLWSPICGERNLINGSTHTEVRFTQ